MSSDAAISFNASGWMNVFQMGVVAALQEFTEMGPSKELGSPDRTDGLADVKVYGTSAGAVAAAAVALGFPAAFAAEEMCQQEVVSRGDFTSMVPLMKAGLER